MRTKFASLRENLPVLLRTAAALTDTGTPAACADKLRISPATVYRHIDLLERALDRKLFDRGSGRWLARAEAASLLQLARMLDRVLGDAEDQLLELASRRGRPLRVALSDDFAAHYVVSRLNAFREAAEVGPVVLDVSNRFADLANNEADVAIRPHMTPGDALHGRRAGQLRHAFYASHDYLSRHGRPGSMEELTDHHAVCAYGHELRDFTAARFLKQAMQQTAPALTANSTITMSQIVRRSAAVGLIP